MGQKKVQLLLRSATQNPWNRKKGERRNWHFLPPPKKGHILSKLQSGTHVHPRSLQPKWDPFSFMYSGQLSHKSVNSIPLSLANWLILPGHMLFLWETHAGTSLEIDALVRWPHSLADQAFILCSPKISFHWVFIQPGVIWTPAALEITPNGPWASIVTFFRNTYFSSRIYTFVLRNHFRKVRNLFDRIVFWERSLSRAVVIFMGEFR